MVADMATVVVTATVAVTVVVTATEVVTATVVDMGIPVEWVMLTKTGSKINYDLSGVTSIRNRIWAAQNRIRQMIQYVQRFGDSNFLRRLFLASNLRYKDDIAREMDGIITDFEAGNLPLSWGGDGNQTFPGQQDIDKDFLAGSVGPNSARFWRVF